MELFLFLGSLFLFLALGIPICVVLILCALVLMSHSGLWDPMMIASSMVDAADNYPLMAIPFFIFAGEIMTEGGLSYRVVQMAQLMIGHVRGGLGYAAIVASIIFAGLMGSSVAEAAAIGGLLLPMMKNVGYNPGRAGAVIASGAIIGPIIPPSTNFIMLGATVGGCVFAGSSSFARTATTKPFDSPVKKRLRFAWMLGRPSCSRFCS